MSAPRSVVAVNADFWIRVNLGVEIHLKDALLGVLHNVNNDPSYFGLPTNEQQLYQRMLLFKQQYQQTLRKVLKPNQWDVLCPTSGLSNSKYWDITLIVVVIINVLQLPPPAGGWVQQKPQPGDVSLSAFVLMARWLRNEVKHGKLSDLQTVAQFNPLWMEIRKTLLGLNYDPNNLKEFDNLETGTLKLYTAATVKLLEDEQKRLENELADFKLLEKHDVKVIQDQLDNFNIIVKSVQTTINFTLQKLQTLSVTMSTVRTSLNEATQNFEKEILAVKNRISENDSKILKVDSRVTGIDTKVSGIDTKVSGIDARVTGIDTNVSGIDTKVSGIDARVTGIDTNVSGIDNRVTRIDNRVTQLEDKETISLSQGVVLDEALSIVVENLTKPEWEILINIFDISYKETVTNFRCKAISLLRKKNLSWSDLKDRLVGRKDIVKKIQVETCITTSFKNAVDDYKDNLRQNILKKRFVKPFLGATGETELDDKEIGEAFVELAIITGGEINKKFLNSNRNYHLEQLHLQKENIQLDELLTKDDRFVIISGVPGIGKSTLVKKIILEWEQETLLSGEKDQPNIRLLFPIICRELNTMEAKQGESPKELLQRLFSSFFFDWKWMEEMSQNILFLVDGVDELRSVQGITKQEKMPFVNLLQHLMKPGFLGSHKCILVGRPGTTRMLQCLFKENFQYAAKKVEVCGFSKENVETYVKKQFIRDTDTGIKVLQKIESSLLADGLSRIPLYAWVITSIFKDNPLAEIPKTATELLLYSFLVFLRNQKEKKGILKSQVNLESLCQDPVLAKYVLGVTEFSYKTLRNNEIIFEANENGELVELEQMGLLLKSERGETGVATYQFQHLTIQELFAAIHILLMDNEDKRNLIEESILQTSTVLVAGFEGILFSQSDSILKNFLRNLVVASKRNFSDEGLVINVLEQKWSQTWRFDVEEDYEDDGDKNYVIINVKDIFIEAFFENQSQTVSRAALLKDYRIKFDFFARGSHVFHRIFYFTHSLVKSLPSLRLKLFFLDSSSISQNKEQLESILFCTEAIDINPDVFSHNKTVDLFSSIATHTVLRDLVFRYPSFQKDDKIPEFFKSLSPSLLNRIEGFHVHDYLKSMKQSHFLSNLTVHFSPFRLKRLTLRKCGLTESTLLSIVNSLKLLTHIDVSLNELLSQLSLYRILCQLSDIKVVIFSDNHFRELTSEENHEIDSLTLNGRCIQMLSLEGIFFWYSLEKKLFPFIVRWVKSFGYEHDDESRDDLLLDILKDMKEKNIYCMLNEVYFQVIDDDDYEFKDYDRERFEELKKKLEKFYIILLPYMIYISDFSIFEI